MGTISDKLTYLQGTKSAIKDAIVAKGVTVPTGTTFRDYATKIGEISGGGGGGRPDFATAGGKDITKIEEAKIAALTYAKENL